MPSPYLVVIGGSNPDFENFEDLICISGILRVQSGFRKYLKCLVEN